MAKIEIGSYDVADANFAIPDSINAEHTYIRYTPDSGAPLIIRGGPNTGNIGSIKAETGFYSTSVDNLSLSRFANAPHTFRTIATGTDAQLTSVFNTMRDAALTINNTYYPYDVFGQNSNTVISYALTAGNNYLSASQKTAIAWQGLVLPQRNGQDVWAPAFGNTLYSSFSIPQRMANSFNGLFDRFGADTPNHLWDANEYTKLLAPEVGYQFAFTTRNPRDLFQTEMPSLGNFANNDLYSEWTLPSSQLKVSVINLDSQILVPGGGTVDAKSLWEQNYKRVFAIKDFFTSYTDMLTEYYDNEVGQQQLQTALAQVISRLVQGEDFNVVLTQISAQLLLAPQAQKVISDLLSNTNLSGNSQAVVQSALTSFVLQSIVGGGQNLANVAALSTVQAAVSQGLMNYPSLTTTGPGNSTILNPSGAGVAAAALTLFSGLLNGGINSDTIKQAAVAGVIGYSSAAIASSLAGTATFAQLGIAAGPIGVVVGAALGYLTQGLFAKTQYIHGETIGNITQTQADGSLLLIGTRPAGSLLRTTGTTNDDFIGNDSATDTAGHDVIVGQAGMNEIYARGGHDMMEGRAAADYIEAGTGDDRVEAGDGNDFADGGNGNDRIFGGNGDDSLLGGAGNDQILGGNGSDAIEGQAGRDMLFGGAGNDQLIGGTEDDTLDGGIGDDVLAGFWQRRQQFFTLAT